MNLYVSNLGDQITDESLRAIFATHGEVNSSKIIKDHSNGSSRGFGFVDMPNDQEAQRAMEKINGVVVNGRNVSVKQARPRAEPKGTFIERLRNWYKKNFSPYSTFTRTKIKHEFRANKKIR